jgi:hypothetical protein
MSILSLDRFKNSYQKREEQRSEVAQAKLTPSEMAELDRLVSWMREQGTNATRSGVVRALVVDGLDAFREQIGNA